MTRQRRYTRDGQLAFRMVLTLFLLAVLYLFFLTVLFALTKSLLLIGLVGAGLVLFQYFASDRLVLASTGARVVDAAQSPDLHGMVERLCQMADLPKPQIALIDSGIPNAFATGRSPKHATVCVTTGLMYRLDQRELEAVLGHELSHIKNRDMAIMTFASLFATVASFIVQMGMWGGFGYSNRDRRDGGDSLTAVYLVAVLVWAISFVLLRALSRYREYAADRGAALLTGSPSHLSAALLKIEGMISGARIPQQDLRTAQTFNAFYIMPLVSRGSIMEFFSTHPSLEHRLERLRLLEQRMELP